MSFSGFYKRLRADAAVVDRVVRLYPSTIILPLLVLGLALGVGVWGVIRAAQLDESSAKSRARSLALDTAIWFRQQLTVAIAPVQLMSSMVVYDPQYGAVSSLFAGLAPALMAQTPSPIIKQLEYVPNGVVRDIYPLGGNNAGAAGFDVFNSTDRDGAIKTIQDNTLTLVGPLEFFEGGYGVIVRTPIFVPNVSAEETFGIPDRLNPACGAPCNYQELTRSKFWGFAAGLVDLHALSDAKDSKLRVLGDMGYRYEVLALGMASADMRVVAVSTRPPSDPVEEIIHLPNNEWVVRVSPDSGWQSPAYKGLLAGVVLAAVALTLTMFAALLSRRRHEILLHALLPKEVIKDLSDAGTSVLGPRILQAETTADLMLSVLGRLLEGHTPDLRDVVYIRQALMRGTDLYQPMDLNQHISNANLDRDVARSLMQQLGNAYALGSSDNERAVIGEGSRGPVHGPHSLSTKGFKQPHHDCSTLAGALALIMTPQPSAWRDMTADVTVGDLPSDIMLAARDTDACSVLNLRQSNQSCFTRAVTAIVREATPVSVAAATVAGAAAGPGATATSGFQSQFLAAVRRSSRAASVELPRDEALPHRQRQQQPQQQQPQQHPHCYQQQQEQQPNQPQQVQPPLLLTRSHAGWGRRSSWTLGEPQTGSTFKHASIDEEVAANEAVSDSEGRATTHSTSTSTADRGSQHTPTSAQQPLRRVASALSLMARAASAQRRSLLQFSANGVAVAEPGNGSRAAGGVPTSAATASVTLLSSHDPRLSGREVPEVPGIPLELIGLDATGSRQVVALAGSSRPSLQLAPSRILGVGRLQSLPPQPSIIEEVERLLARADDWRFDTWCLNEVTYGHPLSALGFYLIQRGGLITHFKLKPETLVRLLRHIEAGYNDNPYHNATHAADVLQTLHVIIHGAQLHVHYLDHLGLLAAYFAAIVHDYGHPGLTNDFLVATSDPLAVRYNDRSPLENHHAAASFGLLQRPELDVLAPLSKADKATFRKQVIEMVLATDMKQHFSLLSQFNTAHRLAGFAHGQVAEFLPRSPTGNRSGGLASFKLPEIVVDAARGSGSREQLAPRPLDDTERLLSLQMVIKAADLGHLGEALEVHKRWLGALEEEFFRQGDKERQLGIPISPLFDRSKQGVSKSQTGFYDFVALPLLHALSSAFPGAQPLMTCFLSNYNHWRVTDGQPPVGRPTAPATAALGVVAKECTDGRGDDRNCAV